jgi:hypothetical protein
MSRLVADQESLGGDDDSGAGEKDLVMQMTLAEGFQAVNAATRLVSLVYLVCLVCLVELV